MHAGFTDSQRELHTSVRSVLAAECAPALVRETYDDPERWRGLWKTVVELGWTALSEPNPAEGMGAVELVLIVETCGRFAAPIPYLSSVGLAAGAGPAAAARLATGTVGALAFTGPGARALTPVVRLDGGRLRGVAGSVADAQRSELLVVLAEGEDGTYSCVLPTAAVELAARDSLDPSRPVSDVRFDVEPESAQRIELPQILELPLTASAAELVGVASQLLDLAVDYAKTRVQFGKPIGAFQGVKHQLANTYVAVEKSRSLTYLAAMTIDAGMPAWKEAALAKASASETAMAAARACVQVHGAIAQTWEHDAHLFVRRAWQAAASLGDSRVLFREAARACI